MHYQQMASLDGTNLRRNYQMRMNGDRIFDLENRNLQLTEANRQLLTEANSQLTEANKQLTEANRELSEANRVLSEANRQLTEENRQLNERIAAQDVVISQLNARLEILENRFLHRYTYRYV